MRGPSQLAVLTVHLVLAMLISASSVKATFDDPDDLVARFEWEARPRWGFDVDWNGALDQMDTVDKVNPAGGFDILFDACASTSPDDDFVGTWTVDWNTTESTDDCVWIKGLSEGMHHVCLTLEAPSICSAVTTCQDVVVQDFLVLGLGDSVASGEGAPDASVFTYTQVIAEAYSGVYRDNIAELLHRYQIWAGRPTATEEEDPRDTSEWTDFVDSIPRAQASLADLLERVFTVAVVWQDEASLEALSLEPNPDRSECHRSAMSGMAQAALILEEFDDKSSVTFVHLACSGGQIASKHGVLDQLAIAKKLVQEREIDALLLQFGANDVGLSSLLLRCLVSEDCGDAQVGVRGKTDVQFCQDVIGEEVNALTLGPLSLLTDTCVDLENVTEAETACGQVLNGTAACPDHVIKPVLQVCDDLYDRLNTLYSSNVATCTALLQDMLSVADVPARVDELRDTRYPMAAEQIEQLLGDRLRNKTNDIDMSRVYLQQYFDVSRNHNGEYCKHLSLGVPQWTLTEDEFMFLDSIAAAVDAVQPVAAAAAGWTYTDGIRAASREHGVCALFQGWTTDFLESFVNQLDIKGFLHPNALGFRHQAYSIAEDMIVDLFDDEGCPRRPTAAPMLPMQLAPRNTTVLTETCSANITASFQESATRQALQSDIAAVSMAGDESLVIETTTHIINATCCSLEYTLQQDYSIRGTESGAFLSEMGSTVMHFRDGRHWDITAPADIADAGCDMKRTDWGSFAVLDSCTGEMLDQQLVDAAVWETRSLDNKLITRHLCDDRLAQQFGCDDFPRTNCAVQSISVDCMHDFDFVDAA